MKILVLVIVSFDKPVYYDMLRVWRERVLTNDCADGCDVWFIQCKSANEWIGDIVNDIGDTHLREQFELDVLNKTLFIRGDECLIPGILHKTVEALSYFLHHSALLEPSFTPFRIEDAQYATPSPLITAHKVGVYPKGEKRCNSMGLSKAEYDEFPLFIWRTNLSSVLDFAGLQRYLGTIRSTGFYGGYVGKTVGENIFFASGAGFLMSRDVAEYLVLNKDLLRWDLIDDVAIGALLEPRYGIVPIERCWIQSGEEVVGSDVFHYRCESYMHLRTVEFMRYVVRGLE